MYPTFRTSDRMTAICGLNDWLYGKIRTLRTIQMGKGPQAFQASQDSPASPTPLRSETEALLTASKTLPFGPIGLYRHLAQPLI